MLGQDTMSSLIGLKSKPFQMKVKPSSSINQSLVLNNMSPQGLRSSEKIDSDSYSCLGKGNDYI